MIEHSPQRTLNQSGGRENDRDTDYLSPVTHGAATTLLRENRAAGTMPCGSLG
jgi:hypothetical protein